MKLVIQKAVEGIPVLVKMEEACLLRFVSSSECN